MRRVRDAVVAVAIVAAVVAPVVAQVGPGLAVAGHVDLELSVVGVARGRVLSLAPYVEWTVTLTNSTQDEAITTTATGITVRDVVSSGYPSPTTTRANPTVTTGSYDPTTGTWVIPSLAPGASATLTFRSEFALIATAVSPSLSAEVRAQNQPDRDSAPAENTDVGDEDDEALYTATTNANRKIGDLVWNDLDGNGRYAAGEPGVRGIPVVVTSAGIRLFAGRTDAAGAWSYMVTDPTTVVVRFIAPAGATFTASKVGDDLGDSDADPTGVTASRAVSGADDLRIDAGIRIPADLSVTKTASPASGVVPVVARYTVTLTNSGPGPAAGVAVTDVLPPGAELVPDSVAVTQGSATPTAELITWAVGPVAAGASRTLTYQMRHPATGTFSNRAQVTAATTPDPDSAPQSAATLCTARPAEDDCAAAVVTVTPRFGTVGGTVWRDVTANGQRDPGEPGQAEVTVRLRASTASGTVVATTVTAANGAWTASSVAPGSYVVEVVAPVGATFTLSNQGAEATDSDVDQTGRATVDVIGGATLTVDTGLVRSDRPASDRVSTPQGGSTTFNLLDNDALPGRTPGVELPTGWTWARVDGPMWGSVICQPTGACTYRAVPNYAGGDRFRYTLTNPLYGSTTVDVVIDVTAVNDPPVARDDRAVASAGQPVTVPVTTNDEDPNDPSVAANANRPGDPPTVSAVGPVTPVGAGTVACDGRECTFSPASGFAGVARFTYTITDRGLPSSGGAVKRLSDDATVEVFVDPNRPTLSGFSASESAEVVTGTAGWASTTSTQATASCTNGRPQVALTWPAVEAATAYRIDRGAGNPPDPGTGWTEVVTVDAGALAWTDDLVGEGQQFSYRVTPLRQRWVGQASPPATVTTPAPTGPGGC